MKEPNYKMYILVKEEVPLGLAMAAVGHASVAATLHAQETEEVQQWLETSFRKVICKVNSKEYENAKKLDIEKVVMTELALDKAETAIAFIPRKEWPKMFKYFRLYK